MKAAKKDFTSEQLPHSRKEQFFDILKTRISIFFQLGGVLLLFSLPFLIAYAFNNLGLIPYAEGNYSGAELSAFLATNEFIFSLVYSVCFLVISVGLSGIARLLKKLAWGQGLYFWHDFGIGIKQNVGRYLLTCLLFDVFYIAATLLGGLSNNVIIKNIPTAFLLFLLPFFMIVLVAISLYSSPYGKIWGNAFALFARRPLTTLLFLLVPFGLLFIELIPLPAASFIVYVVAIFLVFPAYLTVFYLFCLDGFDRYTNVSLFPEYYHRGLSDEFDEYLRQQSMKNDVAERKND